MFYVFLKRPVRLKPSGAPPWGDPADVAVGVEGHAFLEILFRDELHIIVVKEDRRCPSLSRML